VGGVYSLSFDLGVPFVGVGTFIPGPDVSADFQIGMVYLDLELGVLQKYDEIAIFNTVMTQAQIDAVYNAGAGRTFP